MAEDISGPAFPVQDASKWQAHGLTVREYFAAKAMAAYILAGIIDDHVSRKAWKMADAMLAERAA